MNQSPFFPRLWQRKAWIIDLVSLLLILTGFYFLKLGSYPLFTPDEGRYAEAGREMLASHNFITPHVNGVIFLDKPILYYWLEAFSFKLFGVNEWAARFFPALLGVLSCMITYLFSRLIFNQRTALLAALILATSPLFFANAHYTDLNLEVTFFITTAILFFYLGLKAKQKQWILNVFLYLAYVSMALAFLTKGLIGIVFPGLILFIWMFSYREFTQIKRLTLFAGILMFFLVTAPWYLLAQMQNPSFFNYFFIIQQAKRFLSAQVFNNSLPYWFYIPIVLVGFLPWTFFLVTNMTQLIQEIKKNQAIGYLLIAVFTVLVFFSIPQAKPIGYILPVFPPLSMITAYFISIHWVQKKILRFCFYVALTAIFSFLLLTLFTANRFNTKSIKPLIHYLATQHENNITLINYLTFYKDAPFYLQKPVYIVANWQDKKIPTIDNWQRELWYGLLFQQKSQYLIDNKIFLKMWFGKTPVFALVSQNKLPNFIATVKHYQILDKANHVYLIKNNLTLKNPKLTGNKSKNWHDSQNNQ